MYTVKLRGADRCDRCSFKPLNIVMSEFLLLLIKKDSLSIIAALISIPCCLVLEFSHSQMWVSTPRARSQSPTAFYSCSLWFARSLTKTSLHRLVLPTCHQMEFLHL